jgi:hypothetical protein
MADVSAREGGEQLPFIIPVCPDYVVYHDYTRIIEELHSIKVYGKFFQP